jgi:hypothetical protein
MATKPKKSPIGEAVETTPGTSCWREDGGAYTICFDGIKFADADCGKTPLEKAIDAAREFADKHISVKLPILDGVRRKCFGRHVVRLKTETRWIWEFHVGRDLKVYRVT